MPPLDKIYLYIYTKYSILDKHCQAFLGQMGLIKKGTKYYAMNLMVKKAFTADSKAKLGSLIKQAREEKGFSQSQLAERMGVSLQAVQQWEQGRAAPTVKMVKNALKKILNIDVDELQFSGELVKEK